MLTALSFVSLVILGHFFCALVVYFNHRFIFHGKLRRVPGLRYLAKLHGLHHAHAYDDVDPHIFVPWWGKILIGLIFYFAATISIPFSIGMASFSLLYAYRHWAIHNTDFSSNFYRHHDLHHRKYPNKNFSGIYPFIDTIFGTAEAK